MKIHSVKGTIYLIDEYRIKYTICDIEQIFYQDESYKYIFRPVYKIIDLLDSSFFQGIPGINLDLRKDEYIRENILPTFIYERTPQENRQDLWELLDEVNMKYLDKLEWLIRSDRTYSGDSLGVDRYIEPSIKSEIDNVVCGDKIIIHSFDMITKSNFDLLKKLLKVITSGAYLKTDNFVINDVNRGNLLAVIKNMYIYEFMKRKNSQKAGIKRAKAENKFRGRKKINVPLPRLEEVIERMDKKELTADEAIKVLRLNSKSTLYRRIKEFRKSKEQYY